VTPRECPRFDACDAPYCPLDANRTGTETRYREASCVYLREAVKSDGVVPEELRPAVAAAAAEVLSGTEGGVYLRRVLERAAHYGSSRARGNLPAA
jgi:hypothetical protein